MAKSSNTPNPFAGHWRITSMEQWDEDFVDEEEEGYFEFTERGMGVFHFGYVHGQMDCRLTTRDGVPGGKDIHRIPARPAIWGHHRSSGGSTTQ
jgi:hypothetical protein